jgi:hypothetical protein
MVLMSNNDMKLVNGGAISIATGILIVSGIIFLIGVIDGFVRPLKCNR